MTTHTFRTTVESFASPNGVRVDFEQPLVVTYRVIPAVRGTRGTSAKDADIDFVSVERERPRDWPAGVTLDYWASVTDAQWLRLDAEAWADFHAHDGYPG